MRAGRVDLHRRAAEGQHVRHAGVGERRRPSTTWPQRVADAARSALVICGQNLPSDVSNRLLLYSSGKPAKSAPVVRFACWLKPRPCANSCSSTVTRSFCGPWLLSRPR